MNLFEIIGGDENNAAYRALEVDNGNRQYDFIRSLVAAALATNRPFISSTIIKALNFQAIACLHSHAGEYRPCEVEVGTHKPPARHRVDSMMEDIINSINHGWAASDPVQLATLALWSLNFIHPFINGNGRTARAVCYFILCVRAGAWLPGKPLPELLRRERPAYCAALAHGDASWNAGKLDLSILHALVDKLLTEQLAPFATPATPAAKPT